MFPTFLSVIVVMLHCEHTAMQLLTSNMYVLSFSRHVLVR